MHLGKTKVEIGNYQGREVGLGGGRLSQCVCVHRKTFGAPEGFVGFCGTGARGSNMCRGQDRAKKLLGPQKVLSAFVGPGVRTYVSGTGSWKKTFGAPESFVGFCGTRGSNM